MSAPDAPEAERKAAARVQRALSGRLWVRLHMTILLTAVTAVGVLASKLLLAAGFEWMAARWPLCVAVAYGTFFLLVRLWLWYAVKVRKAVDAPTMERIDAELDPRRADDGDDRKEGRPAGSEDKDRGPWGGFADLLAAGGDVGGGCILVLGAIAAASVLAGYSLFLVVQAPAVLGEAAFYFLLAVVLQHRLDPDRSDTWSGSVFRSTWLPALLAFLLAMIVGGFLDHAHPEATSLRDVLS